MTGPDRDPAHAGRESFSTNPDWRVAVGEFDDAPSHDFDDAPSHDFDDAPSHDFDDAPSHDFDDAAWDRVSLPHTWNEDEAFREDIYGLSTVVAWYRKRFTLPEAATEGNPEAAERKVFVEFEGVTHVEVAFGEIVEITSQRHHSDREADREHLELREVECYGPES